MLTTILVAVLFIMGGVLALFGLLMGAVAAANWEYHVKKMQTYVSRVAVTTGMALVAVAVIWGIVAQVF